MNVKLIRRYLLLPYFFVLAKILTAYQWISSRIGCSRPRGQRHLVLLISRPLDVELLVSIHEQANLSPNHIPAIWVLESCVTRDPDVLNLLAMHSMVANQVVSHKNIFEIMRNLTQTDDFLSTVESTASWYKFPYILTKLANAAGVRTYTLQHGFENIGLNYRDEVHGAEVRFSAQTILTWGPASELPGWVAKETRDKARAVGCPKNFIALKNSISAKGARPIIGVFDNLHWVRYSEDYRAVFWNDLKEIADQNRDFHFILKAHPASVRNRDKKLLEFLHSMHNIDIADLIDTMSELTTPGLLSKATGIITTPSTIAIDGSLAKVPVAVTRYGLDLNYYRPLTLLDHKKDWQFFLDKLADKTAACLLRSHGEQFLNRVLIPGNPATKILNIMTEANKS